MSLVLTLVQFLREDNLERLDKIHKEYTGTLVKTEYKTYSSTEVGGCCLKINYIYTGTNLTGQYSEVAEWTQDFEDATIGSGPGTFTNEYSVAFDGVDDRVNFGDVHQFEHSDAFSFSFWVKPNNFGANRILFSKAGPGPNVDGYMFRVNTNGKIFFQMRGSTDRSHEFDQVLTAGAWQHVVITYAGGSNINGCKCYVDDTVNTTSPSGSLSGTWNVGQDFLIASRNSSFHFNGNIDEFTVWDKELSAAEVTELYNTGTPADPLEHSAETNLTSYYKMGDNDVYPTVTDNKGSDHGTMTNMAAEDFETDVPS